MKLLALCSEYDFNKFGAEIKNKHDVRIMGVKSSTQEIVAAGKDAAAIFVRASFPITRELIEQLPNLKLIESTGVGFDKIDLQAANEKGIFVCNAKAANAVSVAEHTIMLMLAVNKMLGDADYNVRLGKGRDIALKYRQEGQMEMSSKRVGIVGLGAIGKEVVKRLKPFGCELYYYDVFKPEEFAAEWDVKYLDIDELCKTCNVISLHAPVTPQTENIISRERIAMMQPDAIVINTARGDLLDQQALADAIEEGRIYGAGIDTVVPEPITLDNPLLNIKGENDHHVILTPHMAGVSVQFMKRSYSMFAHNLELIESGQEPLNRIR